MNTSIYLFKIKFRLFLSYYSFMKQATDSLNGQRKLLFGDDKIKLWKSNKLNSLTVNWKAFKY